MYYTAWKRDVQHNLHSRACLLGRVARVGEGHRLAAKRREWVKREEDRREETRKAHWVANVVERGVFRGRGQFI